MMPRFIVLDPIDDLRLSEEKAKRCHNELVQLCTLREGLIYLNDMVTGFIGGAGKRNEKVPGWLPSGLSPECLIRCAHDWYSLSACNLVRLIGWLAEKREHELGEYVQRVMGPVLIYRNKVAAHFSKADPRRDSEPTNFASTMPTLSWVNGRPGVGSWKVTMRSQGRLTQSVDWPWSLTETHVKLGKRYWPQSGRNREGT